MELAKMCRGVCPKELPGLSFPKILSDSFEVSYNPRLFSASAHYSCIGRDKP